MSHNQVVLSGWVSGVQPARATPAGIPVSEFKLMHQSQQTEAGAVRAVTCRLGVIAIGPPVAGARGLADGVYVTVHGFLAARSRQSTQVLLHAQQIVPAEPVGVPPVNPTEG